MIANIYPASISNPVEKLSPIGYVISTPKSKATTDIGTETKPWKKQITYDKKTIFFGKNMYSKIRIIIAVKQIIIIEPL